MTVTVTVTPPLPFIDVTRGPYNARGDGETDDTDAIQRAIDAAAGGGTVFFPPGTYLCSTVTESSTDYILALNASNVLLQGSPGATIKTTQAAALFAFNYDKTSVNELTTIYPMTTAAKAAETITLATPGQAANFAAGDWIFIRTGQVVEITGQTHPDAEINQVISANAGTGVLTLRWPTVKPYALEHVDTGGGSSYVSRVGGGGAAQPFGVANANAHMTENVSIRGLSFYSRSGIPMIIGGNVYGLTIEDCAFDLDADLFSMGCIRNFHGFRNRMSIQGSGTTYYIWSPNTGCADFWSSENEIRSNKIAYHHIHEGSANVSIHRDTIRNAYLAGTAANAVSVRGRAYDISIMHTTIIGGGTADVIYVDATCDGGGVIDYNTVISPSVNSINVAGDTWRVGEHNRTSSYVIVDSLLSQGEEFSVSPGAMVTDGVGASIGITPYAYPIATIPDAGTTVAATSFFVPANWSKIDVYAMWTNLSAGSGNVLWGCQLSDIAAGGGIAGAEDVSTAPTGTPIAAPAQNVTAMTKMSTTSLTVASGSMVRITVYRIGGDASDTLAGSVAVLALRIRRAS